MGLAVGGIPATGRHSRKQHSAAACWTPPPAHHGHHARKVFTSNFVPRGVSTLTHDSHNFWYCSAVGTQVPPGGCQWKPPPGSSAPGVGSGPCRNCATTAGGRGGMRCAAAMRLLRLKIRGKGPVSRSIPRPRTTPLGDLNPPGGGGYESRLEMAIKKNQK